MLKEESKINWEWIVSLYTVHVLVITTGLTRIFLVHKQKKCLICGLEIYIITCFKVPPYKDKLIKGNKHLYHVHIHVCKHVRFPSFIFYTTFFIVFAQAVLRHGDDSFTCNY